jgi:glyoxylase-like metal-dependent hydrolase (beta-lactamase superfamily II)
MQKSILWLAIMLLFSSSAFPQQTQRQTALREIIPGHYMFSSGTFNSGLIVTSEGVVVLDALNSETVGKAEREAIANTIRQPVRFLVSSTFHNNYSKGNVAYADVWKIGHENYRTDLMQLMQRENVPPEEQKARIPNETYRNRITLYLGGKEIQIRYLGRGHTRGDSIIYVPQDRIAYLSELFFAEQFLYIDDGYGLDWLKTLDAVEGLGQRSLCRRMVPFPRTPGKLDKNSAAFDRCWWISVMLSRKRLRGAQRRNRLSLQSAGHSMKKCKDTTLKGRWLCGGSIGN